MNELKEYRQQLLSRLEKVLPDLQLSTDSLSPKQLHTPLSSGKSLHYLLSRLRFVQKHAFSARLQQILTSDRPGLSFFDDEAWMKTHYDPQEPLEMILSDFASLWQAEIDQIKNLSPEGWNRTSHHPTFGPRTFQWWVEYSLAYVSDCLAAIRVVQKPPEGIM